MVAILLVLLVVLIALNGLFVLAEFAVIKVRPTRIEELVEGGHPSARALQRVHHRMDEYLSVCQVGITLTSIGLGFVGEPSIAQLLMPLLQWTGAVSDVLAHSIAITVAFLVVSFLHIVVGEQVPKLIAIRRSEASALRIARPLEWCRLVFYAPLWGLNHSASWILRRLGFPHQPHEPNVSEDELRIILEHSQATGMISFRRLLLFENVFDLGDRKVRDAMRHREGVKVLQADAPWDDNLKTIRETRLTRFPLVERGTDRPIGKLHVKDVLYAALAGNPAPDLRKLARPYQVTSEDTPLETLLAQLQKQRGHIAIVLDKHGKWSGFLTLEDIIEEIIGMVEDEFEVEPPLWIADALTPGRIVLGLQAESLEDGVRRALARVPPGDLPLPVEQITQVVIERERIVSTYLGRGLALPHGRLDGIDRPHIVIARAEPGIPVKGGKEKAKLLFILLTPLQQPRLQPRLLARIVGLMESEYVWERLHEAASPEAILEAIAAGDPAALG